MVNVVVHANPQIEWHRRYADFFISGFRKLGVDVTVSTSKKRLAGCDVAILFGTNLWKDVEKAGGDYIHVNRKFFGSDKKSIDDVVALGWNGLNGRGTFCVDDITPDRLSGFLNSEEIKNWKTGGKQILLCGQADLGRCTKYNTLDEWYHYVRTLTDIPIKFRPHPTRGKQNSLIEKIYMMLNLLSC